MDIDTILKASEYILPIDFCGVSFSERLTRARLVDMYHSFVEEHFLHLGEDDGSYYNTFHYRYTDVDPNMREKSKYTYNEDLVWEVENSDSNWVAVDSADAWYDSFEEEAFCQADFAYFNQSSFWNVLSVSTDDDEDEWSSNWIMYYTLQSILIPKFSRFIGTLSLPTDSEKQLLDIFYYAKETLCEAEALDDAWACPEHIIEIDTEEDFQKTIVLGNIEDGDTNPNVGSIFINPSLDLCGKIIDEIILWFDAKYNFLGKEEHYGV